jgi:hypothetical protein
MSDMERNANIDKNHNRQAKKAGGPTRTSVVMVAVLHNRSRDNDSPRFFYQWWLERWLTAGIVPSKMKPATPRVVTSGVQNSIAC